MAYIYREPPLTTALWYALIFLCVIHILKELFYCIRFLLLITVCVSTQICHVSSECPKIHSFVLLLRALGNLEGTSVGSYEVLVNV